MGHDIVADDLLAGLCDVIIDVVRICLHLGDLLICNRKSEFLLCLRKCDPELSPLVTIIAHILIPLLVHCVY